MEGLIPLVYKTLRKNKTRRKYKCLSSSAAQSYDISDFYVDSYSYQFATSQPEMKPNSTIGGVHAKSIDGGGHHLEHHYRRHNSSVVDYSTRFSTAEEEDAVMKPKQLVRFSSHRFFSCVTGA